MLKFERYLGELEGLLSRPIRHEAEARLALALDGQPSRVLRSSISIDHLRSGGIFLTGSALSKRLIDQADEALGARSHFLDPTCGAGDLLIACSNKLPVFPSLRQTLTHWNSCLSGMDTVPQLVRAARVRLALSAVRRGAVIDITASDLAQLLTNIQLKSAEEPWTAGSGTLVVLNPPYTLTTAPNTCEWAQGRITQAALFVEMVVAASEPGTRIAMILPDVLRTGPRYRAWRRFVTRSASIVDIQIVGLFDAVTDVDVFSAIMSVQECSEPNERWTKPPNPRHTRVSDLFDVHVGTVVPYRHPNRGPWTHYVHPRAVPQWATVRTIEQMIRSKSTFEPPFVAIRRTSRPGDRFRCVGTIISGQYTVSVENHLLVAVPKDGTLRSCKMLLHELQKDETNAWFNSVSRCRHLTVGAVKELPLRDVAHD
jgi:hypothetical protein